MAKIERFEDLQVWLLAREICQAIWFLIENTSLGKGYELKNQMSRSSGSIMDNIAEGFERNGNREFIHFLCIAKRLLWRIKISTL
ncbi:four helix bundle protein [Flavobacterium sp. DG1-102-2]|uniref:four helix bundle protein n=1 Tax=Flavobacterium sp. DG1-102-2 TaxID=3081663 RepID=UPI002949E38D|nr:four helix bundle protein [Flavobacterium sp. DG1-102-2]MDV6167832.1 four helix bundle protein [Flavobacterium sp. DG1-102-2]